MCGDAKPCGEGDFDVREMRSTINALRGVVIMSSYEEVYLCGGVGGKLVAMVCDVVTLRIMCDMVTSGCVESLMKCVERDESRGENATYPGLDEMNKSCVVSERL